MSEATITLGLFERPNPAQTEELEQAIPESPDLPKAAGWNPETFTREQIRGLVRKVFLSESARPVRQVVFGAVEQETDVCRICRQVGEALVLETGKAVAVMGGYPQLLQEQVRGSAASHPSLPPLQRIAARIRGNLWLVPAATHSGEPATASFLHSYLGEMRREFEYSILAARPAAESHEATAMAQFADGIILVLSAERTRRTVARKIKESLAEAQTRLLGIVLSDRVFPIPERIYRCL